MTTLEKMEESRTTIWWILLFLLSSVLAIYWNSLDYEFLPDYDDGPLILNDPAVVGGGIARAFTQFVFGLYHPITTLSFALDYWIWDGSAFGFRITNILLHTINSVLVYRLLLRVQWLKSIALPTALIFIVHPLHVESVTWISQRKDLLFSTFFLLSLLAYLNFLSSSGKRYFASSVLFFILSSLSKPTAVSLVLIIPLIHWASNEKSTKKILICNIPFALFGAPVIYLNYLAQAEVGLLRTLDQYPILIKIALPFYGIGYYAFSFIFPFQLSPKHFYPPVFLTSEWILTGFGLALVMLAFYMGWRRKSLAAGPVFYLLCLIPVLKIIPTGNDIVSDRYAYLPILGLVVIAFEIFQLSTKRSFILWIFTCVWVLILIPVSRKYTDVWSDEYSIWNHVVLKNPHHSVGYLERGRAYLRRGEIQHALSDLEKSRQTDPTNAIVYNQLGVAYQQGGSWQQAMQNYNSALAKDRDLAEAWANRGTLNFQTGEIQKALYDFKQALRLKPDNPDNHNNLGMVLAETGKISEARKHFQAALRINPALKTAKANIEHLNNLENTEH